VFVGASLEAVVPVAVTSGPFPIFIPVVVLFFQFRGGGKFGAEAV